MINKLNSHYELNSTDNVISMNNLVVADIQVRMDNEGRYCLNDLHKAAGGEKRHDPNYWLTNQSTQELADIITGNPVVRKAGRYGGTYVSKALVYDYAAWVSAEFRLKVYEAYDTLQTQGIAVAEHAAEDLLANPLTYLERALDHAKKLRAAMQIAEAERDAAVSTIAKVNHTLRNVARKLPNINLIKLSSRLKELGYFYKDETGSYRVYRQHNHLFKEKLNEHNGWSVISPTERGIKLLITLYCRSELPMKKGFSPDTSVTELAA